MRLRSLLVRVIVLLLLAGVGLSLGCHTARGIGRDIESLGGYIQDAAE